MTTTLDRPRSWMFRVVALIRPKQANYTTCYPAIKVYNTLPESVQNFDAEAYEKQCKVDFLRSLSG